jgi:hypothetical protein
MALLHDAIAQLETDLVRLAPARGAYGWLDAVTDFYRVRTSDGTA